MTAPRPLTPGEIVALQAYRLAGDSLHPDQQDALLATVAQLQDVQQAVADAIRRAGPNPAWHHETMRAHRAQWPTLWVELDRLLAMTPADPAA